MFSKACEYAIKAMIFIHSICGEDRKINLQEISDNIGSPLAFTAKILQKLRKNNLLVSSVGAKGGFRVPEGKEISLVDIVMAMDGDAMFTKCILGLAQCSCENPCPIHAKYILVKEEAIMTMLDSSLDELILQLANGKLTLK